MGKTIALEGINAAGKSAVGELLVSTFQKAGYDALLIDPAAIGPIGKLLRQNIVHPCFPENPDVDAFLFAALRAEGAQEIMNLLKTRPSVLVILERWALAISAYGAADGARPELISELRKFLQAALAIDCTVLLNIRGDQAMNRILRGQNHNRFELRGANYLELVASYYRKYAEQEAETEIVDASNCPDVVLRQVCAVLTRKYSEFDGILDNVPTAPIDQF
jgi:dTMP kinase